MKKLVMLFLLTLILNNLYAQEELIIPIMIDQKTESEIGQFPINRKYYADLINKLSEYKVKCIVLKFFFDLPKDKNEDALVGKSFENVKVILQARITDEENPNELNRKYTLNVIIPGNPKLIEGNSGWIPLISYQNNAHDLGFIDIKQKHPNLLPLVEKYKGDYVKSLTYVILENTFSDLQVKWGDEVSTGSSSIDMTKNFEIETSIITKDEISYYSFVDVMNGKISASIFENKIVYVGYDGDNQEYIKQGNLKIKAHRLYYYFIRDIIKNLCH